MTLPKRQEREILLQLLYSQDFTSLDDEPERFAEMLEIPRAEIRAAHEKVVEILKHVGEVDALIQKLSTEYALDRIGRIERNILRLGGYELLYQPHIPPKVVLAEAVRLARKYGTPESAKFVNGVLDALYRDQMGEEGEEDKMEIYWRNEDPKE
ncbi:MAG: transcription antitermination factor NusB [Parachlamydiales bacterium]